MPPGSSLDAHAMAVDSRRIVPCRFRAPARRALGRDGAGGQRRRRADLRLFDRLHGARRGLRPLLRLREPVRALDASAGAGEQPAADVRRMGRRRTLLLPADRILVHERAVRLQRAQGLHRQSNRRRRLHPRRADYRRDARCSRRLDARLRRDAAHADACQRLRPRPPPACFCSSARPANPRRFRSTYGSPTRWSVRRRSAR